MRVIKKLCCYLLPVISVGIFAWHFANDSKPVKTQMIFFLAWAITPSLLYIFLKITNLAHSYKDVLFENIHYYYIAHILYYFCFNDMGFLYVFVFSLIFYALSPVVFIIILLLVTKFNKTR